MRLLYPEIEPENSYQLKVDAYHHIYLEESGNLSGIPVLFLHGGPGTGSSENHRRYFDPKKYRIINFDQRGCNRSAPQGETRHNTTPDLLDDIERIRQKLQIEKWLIFGGSWGATLGLLYAQAHPQRVSGLILRGTFLARQKDLQWFVNSGVNRLFPDAWERFRDFVPSAKQGDLVSAYYDFMQGDDHELVKSAARHWAEWSGKVVTYLLDIEEYTVCGDMSGIINEVRIETHYAKHAYFIDENQILDNIRNIPDVPVTLVHGRRDLTCTVDASWEVHKRLPQSELFIVRDGGHLASEPVITDALIRATDNMVKQLQ